MSNVVRFCLRYLAIMPPFLYFCGLLTKSLLAFVSYYQLISGIAGRLSFQCGLNEAGARRSNYLSSDPQFFLFRGSTSMPVLFRCEDGHIQRRERYGCHATSSGDDVFHRMR